MRILQVHTRYRLPGGEDAVAAAEAALLGGAGHEVVTVAAENPEAALPAAASLAAASWNPLAARRVQRVAEQVRPDVAHVHNTWFALSPAVITTLARAGVPVVVTLHNYRLLCVNARLFRDGRPCEDCVGTSPGAGVRHACYRGSVAASAAAALPLVVHRRLGTWQRHVRRFIVLSDFARGRFAAGGLPAERLVVKANAVADPGPRPAPPSRSRTLLFVGRLETEKGVAVLCDAWARRRPADLELVIAGDGPLAADLRARHLPGVRVVGQLPAEQVRAEMLRARALLFPSLWYEGQPLTVLEAFAAGLPVLGSDLGASAELCATAGAGWLVAAGDAAAWATALAGLDDDHAVDRAGTLVRARYEAEFTQEQALRALEDVYRQALQADGGR